MKSLLKVTLALCLTVAAAAGLTFYFNPFLVNDLRIRMHLRQQHVTSSSIDVDGYRIHYFEARPPARLKIDGIPLLLIHGLGSRGEDWSPMIPTLAAQGFHVYAPDLLGYGRSSKPDVEYSIALEEKTVADFMQAVHLDHADVGGWSMGGWVAAQLALEHPERVDRLVLYDSAGVYFPPTFDASLFMPSDRAGLDHLIEMLSPHPQPMPAFVARAAIRKLRSNGWIIRSSVHSMTSGRDLLDFRLHQIHQPTLIVWGSEDKLIPLSAGEQMHHGIEGSSLLVIGGCGHLAPGECTRPVLRGTLTFLRAEHPPAPSEKIVKGRP